MNLKKLYEKITQNNIHVQSHSEKYNFEEIVQSFKTITNQDRPDGIVLLGDTVFVLEHFQISIYTDDRHQDLYQKQQGQRISSLKKSKQNHKSRKAISAENKASGKLPLQFDKSFKR